MTEENQEVQVNINETEESSVEEGMREIAQDLQINLPKSQLQWPIRLIALFTLIGGLSIAGSSFADVFNPAEVGFLFYLLRLIASFLFIVIAYGLIKRKRWAIWLYGLLVLIGLFVNFAFSVFPALIVFYLYTQRRFFPPSALDRMSAAIFRKIVAMINVARHREGM